MLINVKRKKEEDSLFANLQDIADKTKKSFKK